jgi:Protein of unknown function (DUF1761)
MQEFPINFLAVVAAAAVRMAVGMLWYSPIAFGPTFLRLTGCTPEEMKARLPKGILTDAVGSLIMAFILVHAVHYAGATTLATGAAVGLLNWLGFVAVTHFALVIYEKRPPRLFLVNTGYQAIALLLMGAILAVWP